MDLYQNNGIDENRMNMKVSYLFDTDSTSYGPWYLQSRYDLLQT